MNILKNSLLLLVLVTAGSCSSKSEGGMDQKASKSTHLNQEVERKIDSLLSLMTLEEKVGQMNQYNGFWDLTGPAPKEGDAAKKYDHLKSGLVGSMLNVTGVEEVRSVQKIAVEETRLGIPLIIGFDVIHGFRTISPIPLAESASWDLEAIKNSAAMAAKEAAASGINWTFAPMVDISRDARWGRVMEGAGEDPYLGSKIAVARVEGFQGSDLASPYTVAACAKHFAGYGFAEGGRDYNTVDVGTSTLYNTILPPFKAAKEAGVRTFMNAFNELNGIPATADRFLQRELLKDQWNFDGFVVSDWGSMIEMQAHGYARDRKHAAELAANAGSDMDMESYAYVNELVDLVKQGKVQESDLDDSVRRILRVKFELGLFEDPYKYLNEEREDAIVGSKEINDAALDMARKSIVLLKNKNNLLPLKRKGQKVALIGPFVSDKTSPLGSWRLAAEDGTAISLAEGMASYEDNTVRVSEGVKLSNGSNSFPMEVKVNSRDRSGFDEAVKVAKEADVVVMALGEDGFQSGEGRSRAELGLPGLQQELLEEVYKVNKNVVLVLHNGRPLAIEWADQHIPAIVEAWQLGTQSGHAIAQVLYGDYNPSGKLPVSFPRSVGQMPLYYNYKNTGRPTLPGEGVVFWSHYIDEENTPLYPFGHGLSYTEFTYDTLKVNKHTDGVQLTLTVKNNGEVVGKEVVQVYIRDHFATVTRPVKELKAFELVSLAPGEERQLQFNLTKNELGYYLNDGSFILEPGDFTVFVGGSSDTVLEETFTIEALDE
ncbi:beta-glucosidase BglX [Zhouia amylolytica]|uniref:beta-glucosidase n=1 Tax=Zhouia amylolytica AD3 TaxID=1286632 RepID=W2UPC5_9FLAO|nr:beta-glucosidase [Zhouia amylolytica AD3]